MKLGKVTFNKRARTVRIDGVDFSLADAQGRKSATQALSAMHDRAKADLADMRERKDAVDPSTLEDLLSLLVEAQQMVHAMAAEGTSPETPTDAPPPADTAADAAGAPPPEKAQTEEERAKTMDSLVEERADIVSKAQALAPKVVTKGKGNVALMREVLGAVRSDGGWDKVSDDVVRGAFSMLSVPKTHKTLNDLANAGRGPRADGGEDEGHGPSSYKQNLANAWRKPAAK